MLPWDALRDVHRAWGWIICLAHIFFNLNEFFLSICMQHTDKSLPKKWLFGVIFGTVYCRVAGASGGFAPWTHCRAYSSPHTTSCSRQWNTVIGYRAFGRIPLSSMPSLQIWPTTLNSFKKGLQWSEGATKACLVVTQCSFLDVWLVLFFPEMWVINMSIGTDYMLSRVAKIAGWIRIWVALSFTHLLEKWPTFLPT